MQEAGCSCVLVAYRKVAAGVSQATACRKNLRSGLHTCRSTFDSPDFTRGHVGCPNAQQALAAGGVTTDGACACRAAQWHSTQNWRTVAARSRHASPGGPLHRCIADRAMRWWGATTVCQQGGMAGYYNSVALSNTHSASMTMCCLINAEHNTCGVLLCNTKNWDDARLACKQAVPGLTVWVDG